MKTRIGKEAKRYGVQESPFKCGLTRDQAMKEFRSNHHSPLPTTPATDIINILDKL